MPNKRSVHIKSRKHRAHDQFDVAEVEIPPPQESVSAGLQVLARLIAKRAIQDRFTKVGDQASVALSTDPSSVSLQPCMRDVTEEKMHVPR